MIRRALGLVTALGLVAAAAACAPSVSGGPGSPRRAAAPSTQEQAATFGRGARYVQVIPEEAYWVTHDDKLDRVVASGARLELTPDGEVLRSAWEPEDVVKGEPIQGSLEVAPHLGGGYLHWTNSRVFRSTEFTGPLSAISLGRRDGSSDAAIRGLRNGLRGVLVITEAGPFEIAPGATQARSSPDAALADLAALDASRAVRLDVFGRAATTIDGGKSWIDASPFVGISARSIAAGPSDLWLETWAGRVRIGADGSGGEPDSSSRSFDYGRPFQLIFQGTRAAERESVPWAFRESSPLLSAIFGGVRLPDGSALAVAHGNVARVDLATGKARAMESDWIPQGVECLPQSVDDGILFLCGWEGYQGYGNYVLRSAAGEPPIVERAFTDDGYFVADDHGAVGFVGSCDAKPKIIDQDDRGRDLGDIIPKPVICVRRGQGEWAELRVDLEPETSLIGWIPGKDGTAAALVTGSTVDILPEVAGKRTRWSSQGSVRVLRVYQELPGFRWSRPSWRPYTYGRGAPAIFVDKRFRLRPAADGAKPGAGAVVDGWISLGDQFDIEGRTKAGIFIGLDGKPVVYPLPPRPSTVMATGDYGVTIAADGEIYETVDHGRTWSRGGLSPVAPTQITGGCSRLGCSIASVTRVGWGNSSVVTSIADDRPAAPEVAWPRLPKLVCEPMGAPSILPGGSPPAPSGRRDGGNVSVPTGYGDVLEIIRESEAVEDPAAAAGAQAGASPPGFGSPQPAGTATPDARPPSPKKGSKRGTTPAVLSTHTLVFRIPFDPDGPARRLNATNAAFGYRRPPAMPLLGPSGEVSLLLYPDGGELLVTPSEVLNLPPFDARRYFSGDTATVTGLRMGRDRALVLGDSRRRVSLEEHGPAPQPPPLFVALEREQLRKRPLALARRDDGTIGILVLDGAAPESVGVAAMDRVSNALSPVMKLAPWSSATQAGAAPCASDKEKDAWSALILLDPQAWFALDERALPGVSLGGQGIALVRWGRERVCIQALDLAVTDVRRRADSGTSSLVARWSSGAGKAALRWQDMKQEVRCSIKTGDPGER